MKVLETERLVVRHLTEQDAEFMLDLLNQPSFHRFIGDRGVRTIEQARIYLVEGPINSYQTFGFGLYLVSRREDGQKAGICGLLKRETLEAPDIGFAFLPEFWSKGYAFESATGVMGLARNEFAMEKVLAITSLDNQRSIQLLEKLGFHQERFVRLSDDADEARLFVSEFASEVAH